MKKMEYRRPTADLILFENEDIIMTSDDKDKYKCEPWPGHTGTWPDCDHENCMDISGYCHQCHHLFEGLNGSGQSISFFSMPAQDWGMDLEQGFGLGDEDY